ncbi:MAG TPA: 1,4-alpha-glucan branching protein GlgB [Candidatus Baltobacteraceae bacterium]|nr:1,4-alpha-glucan branching protein GlgB [Candidatus Baltobacteraceae bacterium]
MHYQWMGAHHRSRDGADGVEFSVWAPSASSASIVGDFNDWNPVVHPMHVEHATGIWRVFVPGVDEGAHYKFALRAGDGHELPLKADPFAFACELRPNTASVVSRLPAGAEDGWPQTRENIQNRRVPVAIYEVHLGSWQRVPEENDRFLTYDELADRLLPYVKEMGFTHLELMPISEHPFDGSWGYQPIGLYAPTSRFGTPQQFRNFVDRAHALGLGVIIDWVAGHFPNDEHGLVFFDGTHLYEHADPRQGWHPDWNTCIFNFGRHEVAEYLLGNAIFWLQEYGVDGLRVDAVASMLYLDYSRNPGEWVPNRYGGRENLEAIDFIKRTNETVYREVPGIITVAEESTAWPKVSAPTYLGGLGFGFKWNMGWMHDTLQYMSHEPVHRKYHHNELTFSLIYAFDENFVLPLSHDEVVHGKGSILEKMPGDRWQQFANVRLLYSYMYAHPGKKLLFMGNEFAQPREWNHDRSLDWDVLNDDRGPHAGVKTLVRHLNHLYRSIPALYERDNERDGFWWIDHQDVENSAIAFVRHGDDPHDVVVAVCNFTPVVRYGYRIGVPAASAYQEIFNSDSDRYGGSNVGNLGRVQVDAIPSHGREQSIAITLPPLAAVYFRPERT